MPICGTRATGRSVFDFKRNLRGKSLQVGFPQLAKPELLDFSRQRRRRGVAQDKSLRNVLRAELLQLQTPSCRKVDRRAAFGTNALDSRRSSSRSERQACRSVRRTFCIQYSRPSWSVRKDSMNPPWRCVTKKNRPAIAAAESQICLFFALQRYLPLRSLPLGLTITIVPLRILAISSFPAASVRTPSIVSGSKPNMSHPVRYNVRLGRSSPLAWAHAMALS